MRLRLENIESWLKAHPRRFLALILGVNLFFCIMLFDPKLHTGGDNAYYIKLAESILIPGDGYSSNIAPGGPKPHTHFPFGYPLLLAPMVALFHGNVVGLKLFSMALALGCVFLFYTLSRGLFPPLQWAALNLAMALNPEIVFFSHWILSEIPILFFTLLSLWLFLKSTQTKHRVFGKWFWLSMLCIAFTAHIRTIGMALVLAGSVYYLIHGHWKRLVVYTLGLVLLLAPWMIRNSLVHQGPTPYLQQLLMKDVYTPEKGTIGIKDLVERIEENLKIYSTREASRVILGPNAGKQESKLTVPLSVAVTVLVLLGLFKNLIKKWGFLELYTLVSLGILLLWPKLWSDIRFLVPLIPLFLMYMAEATLLVSALLPAKERLRELPAVAVALAAALAGMGAQVIEIPANLSMISRYLSGDHYAGYSDNWRHFFEAADWARKNTTRSSVFTVRKPSLFHIKSRRRATKFPFSPDPDSVFAQLIKTDYVVVSLIRNENQLLSIHKVTGQYLLPAMEKYWKHFKLVFRTESPYTNIFQVDRAGKQEIELKTFKEYFVNLRPDLERTVAYYERKLKEGRLDYIGMRNLGYLYLKLGKTEEAIKQYENILRIKPDDINTLYLLGKINQVIKRFEKAEQFFRKILVLNPDHKEALLNLAQIKKNQGKLEEASQLYKRLFNLDSTNVEANSNLAEFYLKKGEYELAEKHYRNLLKKEQYQHLPMPGTILQNGMDYLRTFQQEFEPFQRFCLQRLWQSLRFL